MARVRAAKGMKAARSPKRYDLHRPPGTGKTTIARVVASILAGLGVIAEPNLAETSRKDFVAEYEQRRSRPLRRSIRRWAFSSTRLMRWCRKETAAI